MDVRVGTYRRLSADELILSKCGAREDSWESLGLQGDQIVSPKGNQPWIFIGRTDDAAPILWPPDAKSWLIGKDPDAEKVWRQEKGMTEDEMVGWHHQFNGHEFQQAQRDSEGQGSLRCFSPWGPKGSNTTERLAKYQPLYCSIIWERIYSDPMLLKEFSKKSKSWLWYKMNMC